MNAQYEAGPGEAEPTPAIVGWMTAAQPLQLLIGGLFVYLVNATFEFLDRPLVAAAFLAMAGLTIAIIPLEAWLAAFLSRKRSEDAGHQISRVYQSAVVGFVVGATLTVIVGVSNALWLLLQVSTALLAVKIAGEVWSVVLKRRIAKPR